MMQLHRDMGGLQSDVGNLKSSSTDCATDIKSLRDTQHWVKGMLWGVWIALIGFSAITWYFVGDKISTLLKMAEERQVHDAARHAGEESENAAKPEARPSP